MTKKDIFILLSIMSTAIIVLGLWLVEENKASDDSDVIVKVVDTNSSNKQALGIDEKEISHDTLLKSSTDAKENIKAPKFVLMATLTNAQDTHKALISVNKEDAQWFYREDTIINNYTIHDIGHSSVTLFEKNGSYYKISLFKAPPKSSSHIQSILPSDSKHVFYGNKEVSDNLSREQEMNSTSKYGYTHYGNETDNEMQDKQTHDYESGKSVTYGNEEVSQDAERQNQQILD